MKTTQQPADGRQAGDSVKVHIEELVLHGFPPGDRHRIARAVESELTRPMVEGSLPGSLVNPLTLGRINGGAFKVKAGAKPQAAGTEIARAVYRGLRHSSKAAASALRTRPGLGGRHS